MPKENKKVGFENTFTILKKTILAVLCCWVLTSIFRLFKYMLPTGCQGIDKGRITNFGLRKIIVDSGLIKWVSSCLYVSFWNVSNSFIVDLFIIVSLIVGFYLGLNFFYKNKHKYFLILLPLVFIVIGSFIALVNGLGEVEGAGEFPLLWAWFFLSIITLPYLFFSFIVSIVFYLKKEHWLKWGIEIIFLAVLIGLIGFGKYTEVKGREDKKQIGLLEENVLRPLYKNAVQKRDPALCERLRTEIEKRKEAFKSWSNYEYYYEDCLEETVLKPLYQNAIQKRDPALCERLRIEMGERKGLYHDYYGQCIEEVAKKTGNEFLCKEDFCKGIVQNIKNFFQKTDLCKEYFKFEEKIQCIKEIALATNNAELCAEIYDVDCVKEIALRVRNPIFCAEFKKVKDSSWRDVDYQEEEECYKDPDIIKLIKQLKEEKKEELPDLIIKDFYYDEGGYFYIKYCNIGGSGGKGNFLIKVESNTEAWEGNIAYPFAIPDPGACEMTGSINISYFGAKRGEKKEITGTIDWEDKVQESNEKNNSKTETIYFY